jgi:hypothetical protein
MPGVGFQPTTPALEQTKTFHALDRRTIVVGPLKLLVSKTYFIHIYAKCQKSINLSTVSKNVALECFGYHWISSRDIFNKIEELL